MKTKVSITARRIPNSKILAATLIVFLTIPSLATGFQIQKVNASGSPWNDDDADGVPNYLDRPEFAVGVIPNGSITLFGKSGFEGKGYYVSSSGIGNYTDALTSLGIQDVSNYDKTVFSIVEEKLPFTNGEWIDFLTAHHLLSPGSHSSEVLQAWNWINCSDGCIRALVTFQFKRYNETVSKIQTREYFFNETNALAYAAPGDTTNSLDISPQFTIGDAGPKTLGPSKTTKAGSKILTVIEWVKNAMEFLEGKKNWTDILEKLLGKAITEATEWAIQIIAGLLGPEGPLVVGLFKVILEAKGISAVLDAIKMLLDELGIPLPWWFPDPISAEGNLDLYLYDPNGTQLLGVEYQTNTTLSEFSDGIYSGDTYYAQAMFVSKSWLQAGQLKVLVNNTGDGASTYDLLIEDPLVNRLLIGPGKLVPSEIVNTTLYLDSNQNITCNQIYMQANFSTTTPYCGRNVDVDILLSDENGTTIQDANEVTIVMTNGTKYLQTFYATLNSSTRLYHYTLNSSASIGSYYMAIYPLKDDYLPDIKYVTFFEKGPGDVNCDFKVSLADLVLLANAYGSQLGDTKWNPNADMAPPYGVINLHDLVTLAVHYGQSYP